jgi:hypothetical protein
LFICTSKSHGALKILGGLEFHVNTNGVGQAAGEQTDLLLWRQVPSMRHFGQEGVLVLTDGAPEWQAC